MLRKAIALNPRYLPARLRLAHLMRESGRLDEAVELFQEAAKIHPRSAAIQAALGAILESSGKLSLALESYRNAIRWAPQSAPYHFNLAKCLARTGNIPDAIETYQRSVELNPAFGPAQANLGTLLLRTGRMSEAIVTLSKALELIPKNAELHFQAAIALLALGRNADAEEHLEKGAGHQFPPRRSSPTTGALTYRQGHAAQVVSIPGMVPAEACFVTYTWRSSATIRRMGCPTEIPSIDAFAKKSYHDHTSTDGVRFAHPILAQGISMNQKHPTNVGQVVQAFSRSFLSLITCR